MPRHFLLPLLLSAVLAASAAQAEKIPIKVIIVAGFEVGNDTGDAPGEFQLWYEREGLTQNEVILKGDHPLCHNDQGLYGIVGSNTRDRDLTASRQSELITALCLDPRYDLTRTYWILTGIAGVDPQVGTVGSAAWAENVVNGDPAREIDDRQLPSGWPYGIFAIGAKEPGQLPGVEKDKGGWGGEEPDYSLNRPLNLPLARWAAAVSKDVPLVDSPAIRAFCAKYQGYPAASAPPKVFLGDALGAMRYWHGESRTQWARDWVKLWTHGKGTFATTSMEPHTYTDALKHMADEGLVDFNRVLVLRTASNFCTPPPGEPVTATIGDETLGTQAAFEAAYAVAAKVAHTLLDHWGEYEKATPQ